ncbi:hypothetical protein M011DRAFT_472533 [Sporormia fimetaria CBS 119925]|uniref:F-box domain-containing protein n=1 Tax=Sporormia fimetaria CBS 119925 TaxID=1340428 RepID=A0A6A6UXB2_9PLEO|nr:hypothetical protein M011DRAFT_472533 [Sporormia fimetaria CBS 119925]
MPSLIDLPLEILLLIFPYLDIKSFLALCNTCKSLHQDSIRLDSLYWSHAVRDTFRVPNQPVVQHDGARWQKLYRRLLTETRAFTWGSNTRKQLGHDTMGRHFKGSYPEEMKDVRALGVIADMQCGGWSTTLLTAKGSLYTVGVLDGERFVFSEHDGPQPLRFPVGFPYSSSLAAYDEPTIAIRQFSSGRKHVLGLSDSGRIWSWYSASHSGLHVKFLDVDITESSAGQSSPADMPLFGRVKKVLAGWCQSSAYIYGVGIVLWHPAMREPGENDETDTMLVMETVVVPQTNYIRKPTLQETDEEKEFGSEVGAVLNYILLENYLVFVTDIGRVFYGKIGRGNRVPEVRELTALRNDTGSSIDVQGSFRRFAIFKNGEVIIGLQDYLAQCWNAQRGEEVDASRGLLKIPALQYNDVISVAFGDYHFLALHSTGRVTAYGKEPQGCGALGLGNCPHDCGIRGVKMDELDALLISHCYTSGREVWFHEAKQCWGHHLATWPLLEEEEWDEFNDEDCLGELSEWVEQESRDWDKDLGVKDDDGLGSHFALSICAAGWHSGSLVLVSDRLEKMVWEKCTVEYKDFLSTDEDPDDTSALEGAKYVWADQSLLPRLRQGNGIETEGEAELEPLKWRFGRPQFQLGLDYNTSWEDVFG